jgi:hypothetical protein
MINFSMRMSAVLAILSLAVVFASDGAAAASSGAGVKDYLLTTLARVEIAADDFVRDANSYAEIVRANGNDPSRAFYFSPAEIEKLLHQLREEYKAMDSFGYETIEGIVAGVPSLSEFDTYLDAGVPQSQAGAGSPVAPVVLTLPDGTRIDRQGSLFTYLIEPMLWGTHRDLVVPVDLDRDGKIGTRESLPRPNVLLAAATDVRAKIRELHQSAIAWQPSTADYFAAIITMTPTLAGYFDDWKESRYSPQGSGKFTAVSRVSDMHGIMSSVAILYGAVRSQVAAKDAALDLSIQRNFDGILAFIDRVNQREQKAGATMAPAEIDELGEQAKQRANKLVPQVEQAAAILDLHAT